MMQNQQMMRRLAAIDAQGFTLFEVLIAMAILALALPILLGLRNWDLNLHSRAADITAATMLAQEKLIEAELSPVYPSEKPPAISAILRQATKCPATSRIGLNSIDGSESSRRRP